MGNKTSSLFVVASVVAIVSCSRGRQGAFSGQQRGNAALDLVAEDSPKLGCVWDGTGCADGCDVDAMEARCQRLSHDQEECESGEGQTERCTWSHGGNGHFGAVLKEEDESMELLADSKMKRGGGSSSNKMRGSGSSSSSERSSKKSGSSKSKSMDHGSSSGHGADLDAEGKGYDAPKSGKSSSGGKSSAKGSGSSSRGSKSAGYNKSGSGSSSSDKPKLGCVWDGTGCHDDECDTMAMEDRCQKLSHDQGECEGDVGSYNRCVWSHGSQSQSQAMSQQSSFLKAHKSNMKKMSKSTNSGQSNKQQDAAEMEEEIAPRLGCIWDQTGCAAGCDEQVMDQRCDRMSHDQEMCEGEIGVFNRCVWSHGSNSHMNVDIHFSDIGEDSTVDILLIVAGVVTAMFIIQQFYKWWRNREYKKVQETQHHEEIQITSHSV